MLTDSVMYTFIDKNNIVIDSFTFQAVNSTAVLEYDLSDLPFTVNKLVVSEYFPESPPDGYKTNYYLECFAPAPIATPKYNWSYYYHSANNFASINNSIIVSDFPENTEKVILGLEKDNQLYDTVSYTHNCIPYSHSLSLNGNDNFISTSNQYESPKRFNISLWFKTKTTKGGKLIGFVDQQNGISNVYHDREILMEHDGSLWFIIRHDTTEYRLVGAHTYNDGNWHKVEVIYDEAVGTSLSVDGSLVDYHFIPNSDIYQGYWIIGRNSSAKGKIAHCFDGIISEVDIEFYVENKNKSQPESNILNRDDWVICKYKLDEGQGTIANDSVGGNQGTIHGSIPVWDKTNKFSFIRWENVIVNQLPGTYNFFAQVYHQEGPLNGARYSLGKFRIVEPLPGVLFEYNIDLGLGYFNEGTALYNSLEFLTEYDKSSEIHWESNLIRYYYFSPDHQIIDSCYGIYEETYLHGVFGIDMGDAPQGSYLSVEHGYFKTGGDLSITNAFTVPIYINSMVPPRVKGNFGPFDQAIAPGTMPRNNTFEIVTEELSDLNKVVGKFYDISGQQIGSSDAVRIDDTTWHLTHNMAALSPPYSLMRIEYYLGENEFLGLVEGPYRILIHRTRPSWFDFIPDEDFHNIDTTTAGRVYFEINTPLGSRYTEDNTWVFKLPCFVPILGGSESELLAPNCDIYLVYRIPDYKLELAEPPEFLNNTYLFGAGKSSVFQFHFNSEQHNSYYLDENNRLFATQNFASGGSLSSCLSRINRLSERMTKFMSKTSGANPDNIIIGVDFDINFVGAFQYASRLHLLLDTLTGKWGSYGHLHVNANPEHEEAYKNSASYHFYSGALGVDFGVGIKIFSGLFGVDFMTDMRYNMGFGKSYRDIPKHETRPLKSFNFQIYVKVVTKELWGWFEQTVWGPRLVYSGTMGGDDMTDCFPPDEKKSEETDEIKLGSNGSGTGDEIIPASHISKLPLAYPQQYIRRNGDNLQFAWIDKGNEFGQRLLQSRYYNTETGKFSSVITIDRNFNAINNPALTIIDENSQLFVWNQSRHNNQSILDVKPERIQDEFVGSQDIWFAVYDSEVDSVTQIQMIDDEWINYTSGRMEGSPEITALSETKALLVWQVVDIDENISNLWYSVANKTGDYWVLTDPSVVSEISGIETDIRLATFEENRAVLVFMNIQSDSSNNKKLMSIVFSVDEWEQPQVFYEPPENHSLNYYDLSISNSFGAIAWTTFVFDTIAGNCETLSVSAWLGDKGNWSSGKDFVVYIDSVNHLQHPKIAIDDQGHAVIAIKAEMIKTKNSKSQISRVDLFKGDVVNIGGYWKHYQGNPIVCDTMKQVADLAVSFHGIDTVMLLTQEYNMTATNSSYLPLNGLMIGDPYMNLVLRCFVLDNDGNIIDIPENYYFTGFEDELNNASEMKLYQNFPNPCTDHTNIQFYIPDHMYIKLELFDMEGVRIKTIANNELIPGIYKIELNTTDLKPGIYFYRLISEESEQTMKMIVGN